MTKLGATFLRKLQLPATGLTAKAVMCIQVHADPRFFSRAAEFIRVDGAK